MARYSKKTLFLILCIMGLFAILSSTMSKNPVLKPFATSLDAPTDLIGLVASASTIPGILISLPAASLSDVVGRRKMLVISAVVFASAPFLYLLVDSWWQLIPIRFYHGFATAIFVPVSEAAISEAFPTKRGERIAIFSSVTAIGRASAPFLGGYILFLTNYGYSTLYLSVGVAGVAALIVGLFFFSENKPEKNQTVKTRVFAGRMLSDWANIARNRSIQIVSLIQACQYYVFGAVEFFLVGYMLEVAKIDPLSIGTIMGSQIIALIASRPIMGKISDKIGREKPIIIGSIVSGLILAVFPFTADFSVLLLLSIGYGLGFSTVTSSTSPLTCEIAPQKMSGTSLGFLSTMMDIGQTLGPIISGLVLAVSAQYTTLFISLSIILVVSAVIFFMNMISKKLVTGSVKS